jgi:multidrug efflux pump subunit AcrA (membrane-fusion protein)
VSARVNPTSRLVEVFVAMPSDANLLLESNVFGRAIIGAHEAIVVPRSAILPFEDKQILYVVENDKAYKRTVVTGIEDGNMVEIVHGMVDPGDDIVIEGNYELEEAQEVKVMNPAGDKESAPAEADKPATKESAPAATDTAAAKEASPAATDTAGAKDKADGKE